MMLDEDTNEKPEQEQPTRPEVEALQRAIDIMRRIGNFNLANQQM
jgi:hypothetical protein